MASLYCHQHQIAEVSVCPCTAIECDSEYFQMKLKPRSFKGSEYINEIGLGHIVVSATDPIDLAT